MAFWGNPITSASSQIDYFVSAEGMEHPFRTRMAVADEPYTEQLVLLEGQGIWYFYPAPELDLEQVNMTHMVQAPTVYTRAHFNLHDDVSSSYIDISSNISCCILHGFKMWKNFGVS